MSACERAGRGPHSSLVGRTGKASVSRQVEGSKEGGQGYKEGSEKRSKTNTLRWVLKGDVFSAPQKGEKHQMITHGVKLSAPTQRGANVFIALFAAGSMRKHIKDGGRREHHSWYLDHRCGNARQR